jgi:MFS family permease
LWLLAVSAFLLALFFTPLLQFTNEYLRDERHYDGAGVALFNTLTGIPGAIGIIVGGRLADVHGRRIIGAIGLACGTALGVAQFVAAGVAMWVWSSIGSVLGAAVVPALGVYGPELFPTALRGRANAIIGLLGRLGSVVGLITIGVVSDHHTFGFAFTLVAVGPVLLAVLVLAAYPETAHRSLEDINPEDAESG